MTQEAVLQQQAVVAWRYFERNIRPETGLVDSVAGFPSTTMWDLGSYLLGLICAHRLGVIGQDEFDRFMSLALQSIGELPLFDGKLPNKAYNTVSLEMTDYRNKPSRRGLGWSALDVCRILVPLTVLSKNRGLHQHAAGRIIQSWDLSSMVRNGQLFGAVAAARKTALYQEGRVGYEQYAAQAAALAGLPVSSALNARSHLRYVTVEGVKVPIDSRNHEKYVASVMATSEPYILAGLEFGWEGGTKDRGERVIAAQQQRYVRTGILTAVSENHVDGAPFFLYSTVHGNGYDWAVLDPNGKRFDQKRTFSTKAAFAWDALLSSNYTGRLTAEASKYASGGGWLEGFHEVSGEKIRAITANTNAIILESIFYRRYGSLTL